MFTFNSAAGATPFSAWGMWFAVLAALFLFNEFSRRWKWAGFTSFVILPAALTVLWFTALRDVTYTDWFHLAKVYSSTAGCIGFWLIRYLKWTDKKTGEEKRLADKKWALFFPPLILAINILEACARDFQIGMQYAGGGITADEGVYVLGGIWNHMNGIAGILNIIAITGWMGIVIRKRSAKDKSQDMLWPDMLWFWIIAYDLWNFVYTYNCLPHHAWYCGFALLLAPTIASFTVSKGAWLQHRAHTLAIWCMFAQTFPLFQDEGLFAVNSTFNPAVYMALGILSLAVNGAVVLYMLYKVKKTGRNPYKGELYTDHAPYREVAAQGSPALSASA
ncbi:MAG: DUF5692 family protein [Spirochaetales bacterium]|nr:DUF5692 family protein [Spirochaetales bacterium]